MKGRIFDMADLSKVSVLSDEITKFSHFDRQNRYITHQLTQSAFKLAIYTASGSDILVVYMAGEIALFPIFLWIFEKFRNFNEIEVKRLDLFS